jgi:hypothetical protein
MLIGIGLLTPDQIARVQQLIAIVSRLVHPGMRDVSGAYNLLPGD